MKSGMPSTSCMGADRGFRIPSVALPRFAAATVGRVAVLAPVFAGLLGSCDFTPEYLRRDLQERRLEEAGLPEVDPSGTASSAGVSILKDLDIRPLNPRRIGADTTSQGFHRYVHRCGTCHAAPDPSLRTASQWKYVFPRMEKHIREVGLIPLGPMDRTLILEFLGRHADEK